MHQGLDVNWLQDLSEVIPLNFSQRGCLGLCGQGPNCLLETKKGSQAVNHLDSFSKVISMVKKFVKGQGDLDDITACSVTWCPKRWFRTSSVTSVLSMHRLYMTILTIDRPSCYLLQSPFVSIGSVCPGIDFEVPEQLLHRARVKSDAMRLLSALELPWKRRFCGKRCIFGSTYKQSGNPNIV